MSNQTQNQSQSQEERVSLKTLKFSFPSGLLTDVQQIRLSGNDLILYVDETNVDVVKTNFTNADFSLVNREYIIHVSSNDRDHFNELLKDYKEHLDIREESSSKVIAKVTVNTEDDYRKILAMRDEKFHPSRYERKYDTLDRQDRTPATNRYSNGYGQGYGKGYGQGYGQGQGYGKGYGYNQNQYSGKGYNDAPNGFTVVKGKGKSHGKNEGSRPRTSQSPRPNQGSGKGSRPSSTMNV